MYTLSWFGFVVLLLFIRTFLWGHALLLTLSTVPAQTHFKVHLHVLQFVCVFFHPGAHTTRLHSFGTHTPAEGD